VPTSDDLTRELQRLREEIAALGEAAVPTTFGATIRARLPGHLVTRLRAYQRRHSLSEAAALVALLSAGLREAAL
jgi:hypothetical protein